MKTSPKHCLLASVVLLICGTALAKLPALSDAAKAKGAEAAAKAAWTGKVEGYQLCKAQDKVAATYKKAKAGAKDGKPAANNAKPAAPASACADPGPFVYTPAAAAATAVAPAPAAAASAKKS